ncbi:MAG: thioredoxin-like domain-containing protein [Rickettsiales bacterium]|nr:thioredoxin-like domain-containing protein [Rickettsiales bacterium]
MVHVSQKDKSLILLILSALVVIYGLWSAFSYLVFTSKFNSSDINKIFPVNKTDQSEQWLNLSRPLAISDLQDRILILNFWSHDCLNCGEVLQEMKKLQEQFGSKITIIGVHLSKFDTDKNFSQIRKDIIRNDITFPVVNDLNSRISDNFKINSLPSLVIINPHGKLEKTYIGDAEILKAKTEIKKLVGHFKYELNRDPLPTALEKYNIDGNVLSFPTKIEYVSDFVYKSHHSSALFISNSGKNNIIITSLSGDIILKIGSGIAALQDGNFEDAAFNSPQGLIYHDEKLYVADAGNHALREIDFKNNKVTTLIGSGKKGAATKYNDEVYDAKSFELAFPSDIKFFPDHENIVIANLATNQILTYNIRKETITTLAGNGLEGIKDGKYPQNALAQTSAMSVYNKKLYFLDAKTGALRFIDEAKNVKTLIANKDQKQLQYPLGLIVDDTGAYISDSLNNSIKKYDFTSGQINILSGTKKSGDNLGADTKFDRPQGIAAVLNNLYVVDSNNNRVVVLNRGSLNSSLLNVMPPLKLPKEGFLEYLPNLERSPDLAIKSKSEIKLKIDLKQGWKINEMGPSFINLLEIVKDDQANLITVFDWHEIKNKELQLPKLQSDKKYVVQGVIYYCENKINALCYINSYEQKLLVNDDEKNTEIILKLAYDKK